MILEISQQNWKRKDYMKLSRREALSQGHKALSQQQVDPEFEHGHSGSNPWTTLPPAWGFKAPERRFYIPTEHLLVLKGGTVRGDLRFYLQELLLRSFSMMGSSSVQCVQWFEATEYGSKYKLLKSQEKVRVFYSQMLFWKRCFIG